MVPIKFESKVRSRLTANELAAVRRVTNQFFLLGWEVTNVSRYLRSDQICADWDRLNGTEQEAVKAAKRWLESHAKKRSEHRQRYHAGDRVVMAPHTRRDYGVGVIQSVSLGWPGRSASVLWDGRFTQTVFTADLRRAR